MFFNQDLIDKINVNKVCNYIFLFNFILCCNFIVRLKYLKSENNFKLINLLQGLEFWSNLKVFIKKIGFFYKLKIIVIEIFLITHIYNYKNWLYYWKFFLIPFYIKNITTTYFRNLIYKSYLIIFFKEVNKLQNKLKYFNNSISLDLKCFIYFINYKNIKSIYIFLLSIFIKKYKNYDIFFLWSIYL